MTDRVTNPSLSLDEAIKQYLKRRGFNLRNRNRRCPRCGK